MWKWKRPCNTCTKVLPAQISPTNCSVNVKNCEYIVPKIHPSHVTNITNHHYKYIHSFPQTQSFQENITHQHFVAGSPTQFSPAGMGMGPGIGMGPMGGFSQGSPMMMGPRPPMGR